MGTNRIDARFAQLKAQGRKGLVTYVTAGDPDARASRDILHGLAGWGADFIELGMPFSDPMADGPAIQAASLRALKAGMTLTRTLAMVADFRAADADTPLILMGYYNPVYSYGPAKFAADAATAGADGLIIVDLPPEEDAELREPATAAGLALIRLVTPTTDATRLATLLRGAGGFLYYVSITGVTGTASADPEAVGRHLRDIRRQTDLPIAAGFGVNTADDVAEMARHADAVVIGSAIVKTIATAGVSELSFQINGLSQALRV